MAVVIKKLDTIYLGDWKGNKKSPHYTAIAAKDKRAVALLKAGIFSVSRVGIVTTARGVNQTVSSKGYASATTRIGGKKAWFPVHRLVALAYIGIPKNHRYLQVNHKDGNTLNNKVSNLEWTTPGDNTRHAIRTGLRNMLGDNHPQSTITEAQAKAFMLEHSTSLEPLVVVAKRHGIARSDAACIACGAIRAAAMPIGFESITIRRRRAESELRTELEVASSKAPTCLKRKSLRVLWACLELDLLRVHNTRSGVTIEVRELTGIYRAVQPIKLPTGLAIRCSVIKHTYFYAHQVVALAKLKLPEDANHIGFYDGDCYNIRPKNLYWR